MIAGIAMVKDEADILYHTISHLLGQGVDYLNILDNMSTDGTQDILSEFEQEGMLSWELDTEVGYRQAEKMNRLARMAGDWGADWIVPFDADEIWFLPELDVLMADVVELVSHVYIPRNEDMNEPNPLRRMQWRMSAPEQYPKVAYRYRPDAELHMGNHNVTHPGTRVRLGNIRHYQYRSLEQVRRKVRNGAAAYAAAPGLAGTFGAHWQWLASLDEDSLLAWWEGYLHLGEVTFDP